MTDLIAKTAEARAWVDQIKKSHSADTTFGKLVSSVIWSNASGSDGKLLVSVDPASVAADINSSGMMLLNGHDPGLPIGKVVAASVFTSPNGEIFIAALLGYYGGGKRLRFQDIVPSDEADAWLEPPLPALPDNCWISFGFDAREIEQEWIDDVLRNAPLRVEIAARSNNAADNPNELIVVGVLYASLVFNPFVTAVASEAAKDTYAAMRKWFRTSLLAELSKRKAPIVQACGHHAGCQISFMFRGKDVKTHYAAHDALPIAALNAKHLVEGMKRRGFEPREVVYEFSAENDFWYPSYAVLHDGRLVADNNALIAVEKLPSGLSLSVGVEGDKPPLPSARQIR